MDRNGFLPSGWREKYRVRITFFLGFIFLWRAQPRIFFLLILGFILSFLGILLRQWSAGCLKKMDELATSGPYALVRHPLYVGSFLVAFGLILSATSFATYRSYLDRSLLFWCLMWILVDSIYFPKIRKEEEDLKLKFSESYQAYAQAVSRFIPKTFSLSSFDFSTFQFKLWLRNREYWCLIGYFLLCALLLYRYIHRRE